MQRAKTARGRNPDVSQQMVLCKLLDKKSNQEIVMEELKAKLEWEKKYSKMLEELIAHYQREINYLKAKL